MELCNTLRRWDRQAHKYRPYNVPLHWNVKTYSDDMEEIVNCAQCGKELPHGESFASLEVHAAMGIGYSVCGECYKQEWQRRRSSPENEEMM